MFITVEQRYNAVVGSQTIHGHVIMMREVEMGSIHIGGGVRESRKKNIANLTFFLRKII